MRWFCHLFGHRLKVPVVPNPWAPISCHRCGFEIERRVLT